MYILFAYILQLEVSIMSGLKVNRNNLSFGSPGVINLSMWCTLLLKMVLDNEN